MSKKTAIMVHRPHGRHPRPAFDEAGKRVVYTSDGQGHAQVYVVEMDT